MFALPRILPKKSPQVSFAFAEEATAPTTGYEPRDERAFFRIDTEIAVRYRPLRAERQSPERQWLAVNLSGGGISFEITPPLQVGEKAWLELDLPDRSAPVRCLGEVVRLFTDDHGAQHAAFTFDNLTPRDQDRIIAFCLAEQRKQLREKVRVRMA